MVNLFSLLHLCHRDTFWVWIIDFCGIILAHGVGNRVQVSANAGICASGLDGQTSKDWEVLMDLNVTAFRLVERVTRENAPQRNKVDAARRGGVKGGPARARSISPERRTEIARNANAARWKKPELAVKPV